MEIVPLKLKGAFEVRPKVIEDPRGSFAETYKKERFEALGLDLKWVQENRSNSHRKGTIRGLHFQRPPQAQAKLVSVMHGSILDVIVDLRSGSGSYGEWASVELDAKRFNSLFVPKGFAHGFCTITEETSVYYKLDAAYHPESEDGIRWDDPDLAIDWSCENPFLSERDKQLGSFAEFDSPF
ncbi:MAG: dTDP-4-dehydrorhamnose 3,5-epimerase [Pyrinomonadaceae bacterium]|nr:dTDP-4-dehydrorhamnose 3,5-epimerase [Pyrinomonadaceae bacterium]